LTAFLRSEGFFSVFSDVAARSFSLISESTEVTEKVS
jgi:hypothetical protein